MQIKAAYYSKLPRVDIPLMGGGMGGSCIMDEPLQIMMLGEELETAINTARSSCRFGIRKKMADAGCADWAIKNIEWTCSVGDGPATSPPGAYVLVRVVVEVENDAKGNC